MVFSQSASKKRGGLGSLGPPLYPPMMRNKHIIVASVLQLKQCCQNSWFLRL